jgi:peptidoglycan/xylan/chitin deacetylase (PgdA/CDA1 family)
MQRAREGQEKEAVLACPISQASPFSTATAVSTLTGLLFVLLLYFLAAGTAASDDIQVPILVYHRFGPVVADRMTVTTPVLAAQLRYLHENGYTVIPLRQLVAYRLGNGPLPPPRSVVLTVDDGHASVYTQMFPLIKQYRIPVTLFIYPSAISHASYAMTWEQLRELRDSGLFDIQSHTYWHPNFQHEKKRLTPEQYEKFVELQLTKSKDILERQLSVHVDMLAWPFGIYDDELINKALAVGYRAALTLDRRAARPSDRLMALPRYLMTDGDRGSVFARLVSGAPR